MRGLCAVVCAFFGCCTIPSAGAQLVDLEKPLQTIAEDISAFAFGPDGRIVYSVRHNMKTKVYDLEHDDIWLLETNGKKRRLLPFWHGTCSLDHWTAEDADRCTRTD